MIPFDAQRVWINVRKSTTEDLLNRITVFRAGMEPEAVDIIEQELRSRGVGPDAIRRHADTLGQEVIVRDDGIAARCTFCHEPAVAEGWGWHRLWGKIPLFPRYLYYCREHRPPAADAQRPLADEGESPDIVS